MAEDLQPPISKLMKNCRSDVIGVLIEADEPLTAREIAEQAGIDPSTFYRHRDFLRDWDVLEEDRTGKRNVYELASSQTAQVAVLLNEVAHEQDHAVRADRTELVRDFLS